MAGHLKMYSSKQIRRSTASWKNPTDEIELTPLIESTVATPAVPRIRRILTNMKEEPGNSSPRQLNREASIRGNNAVKSMENSVPRFGPLYTVDQPSVQATKDKAWDHILKKSLEKPDDDEGVIKEIYLTAIRKVEKQAREAYYDRKAVVAGSTFRWMMIRDGCFFLQLVFVILGCAEHLGYAHNDPIFGSQRQNSNRDQFKKWIESMFYVGNQVPLVVLKELMSQKYFQGVITAATGELALSGRLPGLSKKVLYDVIVLPALQKQVVGRQKQKTTAVAALDLLHGLKNLVMGPKPRPSSPGPCQYLLGYYNDRNINIDLEANYEDDELGEYEEEEEEEEEDHNNNKRRISFPCATELKRAGIRFMKLESGVGARSIRFQSSYFRGSLHLPVLAMDSNIETLLRNLKTYEACHHHQELGNEGREVESYLTLMRDIVQTTKDARLLRKQGIIADIGDLERLPGMLRRLISSEQDVRLTHEFSRLRRQIRDFSSPWEYYKKFLSIVALLTLIQTVFAMLAYIRPP